MADEWQWRFDHRSAKRWLVLVESHSGKTNLKGISSFSDFMLSFSLRQETFPIFDVVPNRGKIGNMFCYSLFSTNKTALV